MSFYQLDLEFFKTEVCPYKGTRHNPKKCMFYHSENDRRRIDIQYDMCNLKNCSKNCIFSHNKVEQLYHPDRYKTKYCAMFQNIEECDYGVFCSFAHNEYEIKIEKLHEQDFNYDFYVRKFKTVWCPFTFEHNRQHCVYAHNPQDFRRDLYKNNKLLYSCKDCPNWDKFNNVTNYLEGGCQNMLNCKFSHGWKETDYHIDIYKTRQCTDGMNCKYLQLDCPFWHSQEDRKVKNHEQKNIQKILYKTPDKNDQNQFLNIIAEKQKKQDSNSTQNTDFSKEFNFSILQLDQLISDSFKFD